MALYKNKYRVESTRLQNWDYRWAAAYFITICTLDKQHFFGQIKNGVMHLNKVGIVADILWYEIKNHAKFIELGEFIVMPNHIHGILILNNPNDHFDGNDDKNTNFKVETRRTNVETMRTNVETRHALSLQNQQPKPQKTQTIGQKRFQNQGKNSISSIIGGYKSAVTKHANRLQLEFAWQSRFYDHIIRNEQSFDNISQYIINNPANWQTDRFH